jgi:hypothetical protein
LISVLDLCICQLACRGSLVFENLRVVEISFEKEKKKGIFFFIWNFVCNEMGREGIWDCSGIVYLKKKLVLNIFYVFYFFNLKFFDVFLSKK